ncbi:MAG TPA: protein-disulfide reductase DsbD domain-containing protein [Candidatus Eisenbacteria bacterium]|nr:protein-disulfide reductase DsbD domain-containing protein [Candidatus Eisenbacteria bacterium]
MRYLIGFACVAFGLFSTGADALAAAATKTKARLTLASDLVKPGTTVMAGIDLGMAPGWHTYWRNPGESGMATKIEWTLPQGVTAGEIQWPIPEKVSDGGLTTYVHHDQAVLLVPLTLAPDLKPGPLELKAHLSWLECKEVCLPGQTDVSATLKIGWKTRQLPMLR